MEHPTDNAGAIEVDLTVEAIDGVLAVTLPPELIGRLGLAAGDALRVRGEGVDLRLTVERPAVARQISLAEEIMEQDRAILRVLAQ